MSDPTVQEAPSTFHACQLCGKTSDDICEFRMWQRCDEADNPIEDFLVTCKSETCFQIIEQHQLLFIEVPWSRGGPGRFMLVCGNCPYRWQWTCQHSDLTANGGKGLRVGFSPTPLSGARICFTNGSAFQMKPPATSCDGNPNKPVPPGTRDVPVERIS